MVDVLLANQRLNLWSMGSRNVTLCHYAEARRVAPAVYATSSSAPRMNALAVALRHA
jgi:hypothetical protein